MKRSKSYDESVFRFVTSEEYDADTYTDTHVTVMMVPSPIDKPFEVWSSDDEQSSDEDTLSPFPKFSEMFEPDKTECEVCGRSIIIGEEGDYHPIIDKVICFPFLENGCQQRFLQIQQFMNDTEKTVVLRHSICNYKPEKRRRGMVWNEKCK